MNKNISAVLILFASLILFFGACWAGSINPQSSVVFFITLPVLLALLALAMVFSKKGKLASWLFPVSSVFGVYVVVFFISLFVSPLSFISSSAMDLTAGAFQLLTGKSPYAWSKAHNDIKSMMQEELKRSQNREIDFGKFDTGATWHKYCVFGPYTSDEVARPLLKMDPWNLSTFSNIGTNDGITTFVFVDNGKKEVAHIVEFPRSNYDFSFLTGKCFSKGLLSLEGWPKPESH